MSFEAMLARYVDAFNRGDTEGYGACYAPDVVLCNGAGTELRGREEIVRYYASLRDRVERTMTIRGVCSGENAVAAALASRFTARVDGVELGGQVLHRGDSLSIESMALYELEAGLFARIHATTLTRTVTRAGRAA